MTTVDYCNFAEKENSAIKLEPKYYHEYLLENPDCRAINSSYFKGDRSNRIKYHDNGL